MVKLSNYPNGEHSTEFYAHREAASKAKWHYDRAGKQRGASLSKGIKSDYEAQLLKHGVTDASGDHKPMERKEDKFKQQPLNHTKLLNVGHDDPNVKNGIGVDARAGGFAFRD